MKHVLQLYQRLRIGQNDNHAIVFDIIDRSGKTDIACLVVVSIYIEEKYGTPEFKMMVYVFVFSPEYFYYELV